MKRVVFKSFAFFVILSFVAGFLPVGVTPSFAITGDPVLINEVLASHTGTDNTEFAELYGTPGLSLSGLSLITVEGDSGAGPGTIDRRLDFGSTAAIGSNGFYLVGNPSGLAANYSVTPNVNIANDYFENSSLTLALVRTTSLSGGVGTLVTGSEIVLDAVALTDGGVSDSFFFGAPVIGPDGSFFPAGARRLANGVDTDTGSDWTIAAFNLGAANTPTSGDVPPPPPPPIVPIGQIQGSVGNSANGLTFNSPLVNQVVSVQGVIYEKTLARTSSGTSRYGFFIQNTSATADSDPDSSDGIFVFMNVSSMLGTYLPTVGDEVVIKATVAEFFNLTQLTSPSLVSFVRRGVDLDAEVPAFDVNPPDGLADANRYWERHEGMRAQVPAGSVVIDSRDVFASTADGEIWLARGDHPIAQRADPYARRAFRDAHPLDDDPALFDNGNGYRIILGSLGIKASAGDNTMLIAPARTFDTMTNSPIGGVYFSFSKYQIMVEQQPVLASGVDPALNAPPQSFDRNQEFSLAPYNVENLYDLRDDPFDGCDFTGNSGCPGVNPPFDYVPASQAVYDAHINDIAQQIINDLHAPDVIFVQEAEDQDICIVSSGTLVCGSTNNADGKPDTLQELALRITALGGPAYDAVYDRNGADDRGIVSAFLYRTDRVELIPASASDPVLGSSPTVDYRGAPLAYNTDVQNPKALNADLPDDVDTSTTTDGSNVFTRPPQVGLFRIWQDAVDSGTSLDLYALSNHFSSTPDRRVGQRTEQALYNAAIVAALQATNPDVLVAIAGDFNVYPRPDDPFAPGDSHYPSDQLGPLYDQGLLNLFDVLVAEVPASAYSYIFQGQTQTLDQVFVTPSLMDELVQARAAHVNSDWPADYDGDGARGASDHDPLVVRFCRDVTAPQMTISLSRDTLWPANHKYVTVNAAVDMTDDADPNSTLTLVSVTSSEPDDGDGDGDTVNDIVIVDDFTFQLRAERSGTGPGRIYTITYQAVDACGNVSIVTATVTVPHNQ